MARKSRQSFLKRQREARRSERAALKRQKRMDRRNKVPGEEIEGEGADGEGVEGADLDGAGVEGQPENLNEFPPRLPEEGFPTPEPTSDKAPVDRES